MLKRIKPGKTLWAVLGAAALVIAGYYLGSMRKDRAYQKQTMSQMVNIARGLESCGRDAGASAQPFGRYPVVNTMEGDDLEAFLDEGAKKGIVARDAWSNPVLVISNGEHYVIVSGGNDGKIEDTTRRTIGALLKGQEVQDVATQLFTSDIVLSDGMFFQYPEGSQR